MVQTHTSTRPEAMIPPASLATDFDEWMAGWAFSLGGKRHNGEPHGEGKALPGSAWKLFQQEPRSPPAPARSISLRQQFLNEISPPKSVHSSYSSSSGSPQPQSSPETSPESSFSFPSPKPKSKPTLLFATEFFEVRISPKGGYGAFATRNIEVGTIVMTEEPLFRAAFDEIYIQYEALTAEQRAEYRSLHGWMDLADNRISAIFKTNRFETSGNRCGIFIKSSRFNHACHPHATCTYRWNEELGRMVFTSINPIKTGDEITIAYCNNPAKLYSCYGFYCDCPSCPDPKLAAFQGRLQRLGW